MEAIVCSREIYRDFSEEDIWRFINMVIVQLIEDKIGRRLLNNYLLSEDGSGRSQEQRILKCFDLMKELKKEPHKIYFTKYYLRFLRYSPNFDWERRIKSELGESLPVIENLFNAFYSEVLHELRNDSMIRLMFRSHLASVIKERHTKRDKFLNN